MTCQSSRRHFVQDTCEAPPVDVSSVLLINWEIDNELRRNELHRANSPPLSVIYVVSTSHA